MPNILEMKEPYEAAINGNWKAMIKFFQDENNFNILFHPMTVAKDTAFHLAVLSKEEEPLKQLLERVENRMWNSVFVTNANGNTVLHEAASHHNIAAMKLLVENPMWNSGFITNTNGNTVLHEQLVKRNRSGQTPLFKAASFGSTKVVKYLASQPNQMITCDNKQQLRDEHRTRNDRTSILHAAVRGEHFGTALELLKLDEGLANLKTSYGMTSLHLLTNKSTFRQKHFKLWHAILYFCIPTGDDYNDDANNIVEDDDEKVGDSHSLDSIGRLIIFLKTINKKIWKIIIGADWLSARKIWKEKKKRKFAFELARKLIKKDDSWQKSYTKDTDELYRSDEQQTENPEIHEPDDHEQAEKIENIEVIIKSNDDQEEIPIIEGKPKIKVETPLLYATKKGMIEIVKEILKEHPQALEHVSHKLQNILHVAASYRQREVFELVKKMQIPTSKLILEIDENSYTVLQHVADTENYNGGTRTGPAYKLQEELEWFKSVEKIMPSFFTEHRDKKRRTAKQIFEEMHKVQFNEAQKWIKETSQSCSAVAVLIATVVFAAAYTVPGGLSENTGFPILGKHPLFLFFTIMDVISLSCSLTAVVTFLSILTSPMELKDFRVSLPTRLTIGFTFLIMSVATTMLAFASTIILIFRLENSRHLTMISLVGCTVLFPVSVLALLHFQLLGSFILASKDSLMLVCEVFPFNLIQRCLAFLWKSVCRLISKKKDN